MSTKCDFGDAHHSFRVWMDHADDFPWIHLAVGNSAEAKMTYHHAERLGKALLEAAERMKREPHMHPHGIYRDPAVEGDYDY